MGGRVGRPLNRTDSCQRGRHERKLLLCILVGLVLVLLTSCGGGASSSSSGESVANSGAFGQDGPVGVIPRIEGTIQPGKASSEPVQWQLSSPPEGRRIGVSSARGYCVGEWPPQCDAVRVSEREIECSSPPTFGWEGQPKTRSAEESRVSSPESSCFHVRPWPCHFMTRVRRHRPRGGRARVQLVTEVTMVRRITGSARATQDACPGMKATFGSTAPLAVTFDRNKPVQKILPSSGCRLTAETGFRLNSKKKAKSLSVAAVLASVRRKNSLANSTSS